jgi:hypothetical protein
MNLRESQADQESIALETPAAGRQERASGNPGPRGRGAEASSGVIVPSRREEPAETHVRSGSQPLSSLPEDVPRRWRSHWLKLAGQAATSYRAAVELKCLDCCTWQRTEARRCQIRGCPLWAVSGRIFGRSNRAQGQREEARGRGSGRGGETPCPGAEAGGDGSGSLLRCEESEHPAPTAALENRDPAAGAGPDAVLFKTETTE